MSGTSQPDKKHAQKRQPQESFADTPLSDKIGDMLRKDYEAVIDEGIPDDFLALLKSADDSSGKGA